MGYRKVVAVLVVAVVLLGAGLDVRMAGAFPFLPQFVEHLLQPEVSTPEYGRVIDLDQDGDLDILGTSYQGHQLFWWENDGAQNFSLHVAASDFRYARTVDAADLEGDGDLDLLGASSQSGTGWFENDGALNFAYHQLINSGDPRCVRAADMDGDLDVDILGTLEGTGYTVWWANDGLGNFGAIQYINDVSVPSYWAEAVDLDEDGDMDVLGAGDPAISWWENNGAEIFTRHVLDGSLSAAVYAYPTDLDEDGDLDVLGATNGGGGLLAWYENNGSQTFGRHDIYAGFGGVFYAAPADFDLDGDVDLAAALSGQNTLAWWENDGSQVFSEHVLTDQFAGVGYADAVDLDQDGDQDIVASAYSAPNMVWWEQSGLPGLDTTPPAAVSDLQAITGGLGAVGLSWTAPGDDGGQGTATSYDLRYASAPITEANWGSASPVSGEPAPAAAGTSQGMTVSGLTPGASYYFALKTEDEAPNVSPVSNSPAATAGSSNPTYQVLLPAVYQDYVFRVYAETVSDGNGQLSVAMPDGRTALFQLVGEDGEPGAGVPVTSIADYTGISLVTAQVTDTYMMAITFVPVVSLTWQTQALGETPYPIGLNPRTLDGVLVEDDEVRVNLEHLRSLPPDMQDWQYEHMTYEAFFEWAPRVDIVATFFTKGALEAWKAVKVEVFTTAAFPSLSQLVTDVLHPDPAQVHLFLVDQARTQALDLGPETGANTSVVFGQIVDSFSGRGIEGANVQVEGGSPVTAVTLRNGWFQIEALPAGHFRLRAQASGYNGGGVWAYGEYFDVGVEETVRAPSLALDSDSLYHELMFNGDFETGTAFPWHGERSHLPTDKNFIVNGPSASGSYAFKLGGFAGEDWREAFYSPRMFMPAGTVGAMLTFQYRIDAVGTGEYEDAFMVDVCRIERLSSICTGDLFGGPTVKVYTNADDTGGQWVSESIDLLALEEPDWDHLPRRFWLRFRAIPSAQDPVTTMYIDHVSIQVQGISGLAMDMNYVYVEDYFGNPQTVFQPGEAIRLGLDATNLTQETITATYFWTTVDAGEWVVTGLSYGPWATSALPGEEQDWYITRGVPSDAAAGAYTFSGRVDALAGSDSASLGFTVAGAPLPITYLEAFTCKDVQNNDPVEITDSFTTND